MKKQTSGEAIGYTYHTTRGGVFSGLKFFTKLLGIAFDDKDIVSEIDYTTTGNK